MQPAITHNFIITAFLLMFIQNKLRISYSHLNFMIKHTPSLKLLNYKITRNIKCWWRIYSNNIRNFVLFFLKLLNFTKKGQCRFYVRSFCSFHTESSSVKNNSFYNKNVEIFVVCNIRNFYSDPHTLNICKQWSWYICIVYIFRRCLWLLKTNH